MRICGVRVNFGYMIKNIRVVKCKNKPKTH